MFWKINKSLTPVGIQTLDCLAHSPVTISTMLSWFPL